MILNKRARPAFEPQNAVHLEKAADRQAFAFGVAGARCAWVLGDVVYGSDSRLRRMLQPSPRSTLQA